jgi:hypothetical protein
LDSARSVSDVKQRLLLAVGLDASTPAQKGLLFPLLERSVRASRDFWLWPRLLLAECSEWRLRAARFIIIGRA